MTTHFHGKGGYGVYSSSFIKKKKSVQEAKAFDLPKVLSFKSLKINMHIFECSLYSAYPHHPQCCKKKSVHHTQT